MHKDNLALPVKPGIRTVNEVWLNIIGGPESFPLEGRIYHSISFCLMLLACVYIPYNIFVGMYTAAVSFFIVLGVLFYQFYNSRYRHIAHSNLLFGVTGLVLFSVNYFANSGIDGSTDLIWPVYLLMIFAISPYRQHLAWLIIYIVTFFIVHTLAYQHPELVQYPFKSGRGQFIDRLTIFPIPVIAIYFIIKFIRRSYDKERVVVEMRNKEITLQKGLLEESNAEKNRLMSILSHDMRAPLINIQNYLELLNDNGVDNTQRPALEKDLLEATNNTMQMLSNLLYWTKSQMERPTVNLQTMGLLATLKSTLEMEKMLAVKKDIALNYAIDNNITVIADADMLQLVVRNLVNNAIKFTPPKGKITVNAELLNGKCKLTITDTGRGIDPAEQQNIFRVTSEPSFGTNNERGVGLGLLLCKEFTERQGGSIGFESVLGQGSCFYVTMDSGQE